jgi:hypothetical protein
VPPRLPRSLTLLLLASAALSVAAGGYLEWRHLDFLQAHPIAANLLSGVIGFSTSAFVVAVVFNRIASRHRFRGRRNRMAEALIGYEVQAEIVRRAVPPEMLRVPLPRRQPGTTMDRERMLALFGPLAAGIDEDFRGDNETLRRIDTFRRVCLRFVDDNVERVVAAFELDSDQIALAKFRLTYEWQIAESHVMTEMAGWAELVQRCLRALDTLVRAIEAEEAVQRYRRLYHAGNTELFTLVWAITESQGRRDGSFAIPATLAERNHQTQ